MDDLNTYPKIAGKVLKSSRLIGTKQHDEAVDVLQFLLEQERTEVLLRDILNGLDDGDHVGLKFNIFSEVFTKLMLRFMSESTSDQAYSMSKDELLEILRISLEEELYNIQNPH